MTQEELDGLREEAEGATTPNLNLYDFDETIYSSDSTRDFCIYLYLHHPRTLYSPKQLAALAGYMSGKLDKTEFKERYFSMFKAVPDIR